jgi:hypothetical protein
MQKKNQYEVFQKESPEVFDGFNGLVESLMNTKATDPETKQLSYPGIKAPENALITLHGKISKNPFSSYCYMKIRSCKSSNNIRPL